MYVAIQSTAKETIDNLFNETLRNRTDAQRPVDSFAGASVSSQTTAMQGIGGGSRAPPAPKDDWLNRAKGTFAAAPCPPSRAACPALRCAAAQPRLRRAAGASAAADDRSLRRSCSARAACSACSARPDDGWRPVQAQGGGARSRSARGAGVHAAGDQGGAWR